MKRTIITIAAIITVALCGYYAGAQKSESEYMEMLEMRNAETALLQLISEDDPDTWCDVIAETDEYLNCVELGAIAF